MGVLVSYTLLYIGVSNFFCYFLCLSRNCGKGYNIGVITRNHVKECKMKATFANLYELGVNYVGKMLAIS